MRFRLSDINLAGPVASWTFSIFASLLILALFTRKSLAILCFDGAQCGYSCSECEGVGCLRIVRQVTNHDSYRETTESRIALTCLPPETFLDSEPAGCRTDPINQQRVCVCYDRDFCNSTISRYKTCNMTRYLLVLFVIFTSLTAIGFL